MNIEEIKKIRETMSDVFGFLPNMDLSDIDESSSSINRFILFLEGIEFLNSIILQEKEKYLSGDIFEKYNLYSHYSFIKETLPRKDLNDVPDVSHAVYYLYSRLMGTLKILELNSILPNKIKELSFNSESRTLYIPGTKQPIEISKRTNPNRQSILLGYLFKASEENDEPLDTEISYDEILEIGFDGSDNLQVNCSIACRDINEKISKQTNGKINDFLLFSTTKKGHVKINFKYI